MTDTVGRIDAIVTGHGQTLADIRRRVQVIDGRSSRTLGAEPRKLPAPRTQRIMRRVDDVDAVSDPPTPETRDDQRPRSWLT